jgi:hypothetical protein
MTDLIGLFDFWNELPAGANIHPQDEPIFKSASWHTFETSHRPPGPWDGPLKTAKVVICYANPGYDPEDKSRRELISKQLSGKEELPDCWDDWYMPRIGTIGLPATTLRRVVSIFNICPYSSVEMNDREIRLASGLPSVWAAQKHLREALIPQAMAGQIFLVVARKHQLWGVVEGNERETFRLIRNRAGYLAGVGPAIGNWLREKHGIRE